MPTAQTLRQAMVERLTELYRQYPPPRDCTWTPLPDGSVVLACGPRTPSGTTIAVVPDEES